MDEDDDKAKAGRLARRAAGTTSAEEREALFRRAARLVGRAEARKLWRKYGLDDSGF